MPITQALINIPSSASPTAVPSYNLNIAEHGHIIIMYRIVPFIPGHRIYNKGLNYIPNGHRGREGLPGGLAISEGGITSVLRLGNFRELQVVILGATSLMENLCQCLAAQVLVGELCWQRVIHTHPFLPPGTA